MSLFMWLHSNSITEIPTQIGYLTYLRYLLIYENSLENLPSEIGALKQLVSMLNRE